MLLHDFCRCAHGYQRAIIRRINSNDIVFDGRVCDIPRDWKKFPVVHFHAAGDAGLPGFDVMIQDYLNAPMRAACGITDAEYTAHIHKHP